MQREDEGDPQLREAPIQRFLYDLNREIVLAKAVQGLRLGFRLRIGD